MLEYDWGSPSFPPSAGDDDPTPALQPYPPPTESPQTLPCFYPAHFHPDIDPRAFPGASYPPPPPHPHSHSSVMISSLEMDSAAAGFMMIPKAEPGGPFCECHPHHLPASGIALNLGLATGRTYFSAADDDFVSRLYRRSGGGPAGNAPRCQAEGCNADLTHAKHYHRRHKVCDFHSKAPTVVAAGITQRFCQQCSRFHLLTEFDNGKRSCRRRLADHNRRRRKSNQPQAGSQDRRPSQNTPTSSSDNPPRSPAEAGTVAISPGRMEESRPSSYNSSSAASSSVSTPPSTSMYY